jgi:hypothetical protein
MGGAEAEEEEEKPVSLAKQGPPLQCQARFFTPQMGAGLPFPTIITPSLPTIITPSPLPRRVIITRGAPPQTAIKVR